MIDHLEFHNGRFAIGEVTAGRVVTTRLWPNGDDKQLYGHIKRFSRNSLNELILIVDFEDGLRREFHPYQLHLR